MKVALAGGAYTAHSVIAAAQRCVNLFPEPGPMTARGASSIGEPSTTAHYPTPGIRLLGTIGTGPIRGGRQCTTGGVYVVSGDTLYSVDASAWTGTALGTLTPGLKTPVSMQDNGLDMIVVDGTANGWDVTLSNNAFSKLPGENTQTPVLAVSTAAIVAGTARYTPFVGGYDGAIVSVTVSLGTGYTGHMKCSLFERFSDGSASVLGSANPITNPVSGPNTFTFNTPIPVSKGTTYGVGFDSDTSAGTWSVSGDAGGSSTTAYASFPDVSATLVATVAVVCSLTTNNDPQGMFTGADRVDYLDTFFLFNKPGTPQFYISGSLAVTFDSLDFANKEAYPDLLVTVVVAHRLVYLFGERTTEIWYDAGLAGFSTTDPTVATSFQFAAMQSQVFIDHGCAAKYSPSVYDNKVFWLTKDRQGQGIVMMVEGEAVARVSTYAIEAEIAGYERISDAIGFTYQLAGHTFYVLTFPHADKTWSYDITTKLWHEWLWIDTNGDEHRHRANCFWAVNDLGVVGDWQNGNLYALDNRVFTDNGQPIKRVRAFPHMLNDGKRVFYRQFLADLETGNAPLIPIPTPPAVLSGFRALPLLPSALHGAAFAVSADGHIAVGYSHDPAGDHGDHVACYWPDMAGPVVIGTNFSEAYGASANGSVIVGNTAAQPFVWTVAGGLVLFAAVNDVVWGISADGTRIIGSTPTGVGTFRQACYWTRAGVKTLIPFLPTHTTGRTRAVSTDGTWIVGESVVGTSALWHAWRWSAATGTVDLGLPVGVNFARAYGVSDAGTLVAGDAGTGVNAPFQWTPGAGMTLLPVLPGGGTASSAVTVSADGSTIGGYADYVDPVLGSALYGQYFAYWVGGVITVPLPVPLDPPSPDQSQTYPTGSNADGTTTVGYTFNGTNPHPWIYHIAAPVTVTATTSVNMISLEWSDDRGHSYGSPVSQAIGDAGEYRTSLQWQRLGMTRDRVFRLSWSTPLATALQGAWIDVTPAQS